MHLTQSTLLAFLQGRLPEEDATDAMGHLALCEDCGLRLAALKKVREDFDGTWQSFVSELRADRGDVVAEEQPARKALAFAVRVMLDAHRRIAAVGTQLIPDLVPRGLPLHLELNLGYGGVGDAERPPEVDRLQTEAAKDCGEGAFDQAAEKLQRVTNLQPDAAEVGNARGAAAGGLAIEVMVDASRGTISVIAHLDVPAGTPPHTPPARLQAVLLRPDGASLRRAAFEEVEGASYWLAEFESVPDGRFVVGVDSIERSPGE